MKRFRVTAVDGEEHSQRFHLAPGTYVIHGADDADHGSPTLYRLPSGGNEFAASDYVAVALSDTLPNTSADTPIEIAPGTGWYTLYISGGFAGDGAYDILPSGSADSQPMVVAAAPG